MGAPHTCPTCDRPHGCEYRTQLAERDAIIDELLVLLGQHLHPAFDERCIALRARVNALRNGETP